MSSEANSIWQTPCAAACFARSTIASTGYETTLPRAIFVLQYVQLPRQPALIVMISAYLSFLILGNCNDGRSFRLFANLTVCPLIDCSTTSTTRSSCETSRILTPSAASLSARFRSLDGTQPARTTDFPDCFALLTRLIARVSEGC